MKIFEGKTPAERNKTIAALVLGALALIVFSYTILIPLFFSSKKTTTVSNSPTPKPSTSPNSQTISALPTADEINSEYTKVPVYYTQPPYAPEAGRNIFAFYEPPPPTPYSPTPPRTATPFVIVDVTPIPTPTPPFTLFSAAPANGAVIYAGQPGFPIEISGDKFTPDSQVFINNEPVPTTFVNSQRLTANISANFIASAGNLMIMVRTPDGKYSNPVALTVQAAPQPMFKYIGVTIRKGNNNNSADIREDPNKDSRVRLNDEIAGRFKVVSISKNEIVVQDKFLGFRYNKQLESLSGSTSNNPRNNQNPNNNPNVINPTNPNCPPGIPCDKYPIVNPNVVNPTLQQQQQQKQQQQTKDDYDDDDGPN